MRYDKASKVLEVKFRNDYIYQYFDVPESTFGELQAAQARGKFFNAQVKGHFRYARIKWASINKRMEILLINLYFARGGLQDLNSAEKEREA
ncbi:MAG TPA: KTSC domain-containing protein [Candidatus Lokiarchaeia archaeon]|nr:KTSC domain-containing protein [Candidatus Lokiarchaeia archaeon]